MSTALKSLAIAFRSPDFNTFNLIVKSKALKNNPLGDDATRCNYVLKPKAKGQFPVVFHLSGYFGNGVQSFNSKTLEISFPDLISQETANNKIPLAHHIFVDAMTAFGGSQFINSKACGDYSDYVSQELVSAVEVHLPTLSDAKTFCVMGASSGGYGALYHVAQQKSPFGVAIAIAPDSAFEISLLADYYKVSEALKEIPDVKALQKKLKDSKFRDSKNFFPIMNAVAMALCYSDTSNGKINYPIDLHTGEIKRNEFASWKKKDPLFFLEKAHKQLKKVSLYLDVGRFDEFHLQFGARRIHNILNKHKIKHQYSEFDGGHFRAIHRKIEALHWLKRIWS